MSRRSYDASRRRYCAALYRLGFTRRDDAADPIVFEKALPGGRRLEAFLGLNNRNVLSCWTFSPEGGWQLSSCIEFRTVAEMEAAIASKLPTPQGYGGPHARRE